MRDNMSKLKNILIDKQDAFELAWRKGYENISELVDNYQHFHNEILGKPSIDPRSDCDDFLLMTDQNIPI
jgi:hypothetical protein|tara:strand:+ start:169 stop:378 length:210 start_codon:yes stop_codon:yes gene_type:complete